jgi:predicted small secreted protein
VFTFIIRLQYRQRHWSGYGIGRPHNKQYLTLKSTNEENMKKFLMIVSVLAMSGLVAGCANTLDGAGKDIEGAGEKVQETF